MYNNEKQVNDLVGSQLSTDADCLKQHAFGSHHI